VSAITAGIISPKILCETQNCKIASRGVPRNFEPGGRGGGGVQQIQLRTEDRENGDLGAVAPPQSGVLEAAVIWYKKNFISYSRIFLIFGILRLFMMTTDFSCHY